MKIVALSLALGLAGCRATDGTATAASSSAPTADAPSPVAAAPVASAASSAAPRIGIIQSPDVPLSLQRNWYPFETYKGERFRWVSNDAEILIRHPSASTVTLSFELEAGPGLATTKFPLQVLDASGHVVTSANIDGRQRVSLVVPVTTDKDNLVKLHVNGGGHSVPNERRILNFRVFSVTDKAGGTVVADTASGPQDIADPANGVTIGRNWYPLETFKGQTFRWVANDAHFTVSAARDTDTRLRVAVEAGPGLGSPNFPLKLDDASNHVLATGQAKGRSVVMLPVHLRAGTNELVLHVDGGGKPSPNDARTLNFRVFALSALR